ncbi:MAG: hypothetical protein IKD81_03635, partial [Eubacteriaceae bacterium]|nr:hypothetical protein [Eubacteriaceae bacterium]
DALEAKKGENVTINVNAATQVEIKFFNDWLGTEGEEYGLKSYVNLGNDSPAIHLEDVIYEYDGENYLYTFDTQGLEYELTTNAGRPSIIIKKPDRDLMVIVSRTAVVPGELTTRSFTVGASEYTLAVFAGIAEEGKTMFYDGEQMVKTSEGYVCIIGVADTAATKTKITQETGTDLVMTVTGDVNQTGVIDINDAQLVSDLYNGKYTDGFETVAMVKYLAADVNGDGAVSATDIAAVVQNSGFVY